MQITVNTEYRRLSYLVQGFSTFLSPSITRPEVGNPRLACSIHKTYFIIKKTKKILIYFIICRRDEQGKKKLKDEFRTCITATSSSLIIIRRYSLLFIVLYKNINISPNRTDIFTGKSFLISTLLTLCASNIAAVQKVRYRTNKW